MTTSDLEQEKAIREEELRIQRQIAFASGLFQGDVTLRTLLESLIEGVVIIDNSRTILLMNAAAEQMFGYQRNELIGKPQAVLIPERFRKIHEDHQAGFFAEPGIRPMDQHLGLTGRRRDGSEFPVEISLSYIETINGVLGMGLISDITLRKQIETRLRESEELFHIQVEGIQDYAIFMLDTRGNVLNWNAGAERLKGYRADEIIGAHFSCFYPEEERNAGKPEAELKKAAAEGRLADEGWRIRKDGSRFWADVIITALYDESGKLRGFSKVTHDISGRKKVEDALRFSEARFRALFRDNPTMIVTLDADLMMISVNPVCASQLRYTIAELEGQSVLKLFHEDDRPAVAEQLRTCLQNPNQVNRWQFRKIRSDGSLLWVEETAQAVYDLGGALNVLVVCQDITERKQAEDALRESEERFRATFNQAAVGIGHVTPDGHWLRINQKYCDVIGYTAEEMKALSIKEITHPDDQETSMHHYQLLLEGKVENYSLEKRYIRKDGLTVWVNLTTSMVFDSDGKPIFAVGVIEDISKRKRAEEERERLFLQLEAVLECINEGVVISDLEGNVLTMNKEALALHEYESVDQVQRQLSEFQETFELFDLEGLPVSFEQWPTSRAIRGERFTDYEVRLRRTDTGKLWIGSYNGTPVLSKSGDIILSVITVRDISERKRVETALRKSELKFSKIFHSVPALIGITTVAEGRCIDINEAGLRTLGYRREEMVGRTMLELGVWGSKSACDQMNRVLQENGLIREMEINFKGKNGKTFTGLFSAELIDFNGDRYMLSIVNDITERKRMEEEIEQLNIDLAERAVELEVANRELESFNYTVAHDLRNPLNVISSYCQVLKELCSDKLDETCRRYIQEAYDGTLRMNRLIEVLLNFSRLTHVETHRETVDLSAMAHEVAAALKQAEPERRVTFIISAGVSADVDAALLQVVLDNLFGNAWKYTAIREEGIIEFGLTELDGKPACYVRDNGNGFNMADADKLFAPFQRLPGAEECRGFGIGLATVERIIRRHGGKVWAEGAPGEGATFYFTVQAHLRGQEEK